MKLRMERELSRHGILPVGGVVLLMMVAGCSGFGWPSRSPTQPDKPTPVTEANVVDFVTEHVTATLNEENPDADIDCDGALHMKAAGGYYVLAPCEVTTSSGGAIGHGRPFAAYFVDNETTRTIWLSEGSYRDPPKAIYGENDSDARSESSRLRLINFANSTREVTVNITYLDTTTSEQAFAHQYSVLAQSTIWQVGVSAKPGTYRVTVTTDNDTTTTYRWTLPDSESEAHAKILYIYINSDGSLDVKSGPDRTGVDEVSENTRSEQENLRNR